MTRESKRSSELVVLVVGGGGREHALAWKIASSPLVSQVVCAPGNAGTAGVARNVPVAADDLDGLVALAREERADLVVVGPEDPLCAGLADRMREAGLSVFGPGRAGAELEGSKVAAKEFLMRHRIPTAAYRRFDSKSFARHNPMGCGDCGDRDQRDEKATHGCRDVLEAFGHQDRRDRHIENSEDRSHLPYP
jgi:hypothetical protein